MFIVDSLTNLGSFQKDLQSDNLSSNPCLV